MNLQLSGTTIYTVHNEDGKIPNSVPEYVYILWIWSGGNVPIPVIFHFQYRGNITSGLWTLNTTPEDLVRARYNTGTTPSPSGRHSASTGGKRRTDGHVTVAGQQTCQPMLWLSAGCYNFIQCFTRRRALVDFRDTS